MKLLIITQKVNKIDPILGFFHGWIIEFAKHFESITVICLEKGEYNLPANVKVLSLGKESGISRPKYLFNFYKYIWQERGNYDAVFVHMNPIYVLLGGFIWKLISKKIYLWYTHKNVDLKLKIAVLFSLKVFSASKESFRYKNNKLFVTGHGIDTDLFKPNPVLLSNDILRIITVGRISPVKKRDMVIRAVSKIIENNKDITLNLTLVGGPIYGNDHRYENMLHSMVCDNKIEQFVKFTGPISPAKVVSYLQNSNIFVHESQTGSLDKVALESLSCGLIVLSSNDALRPILEPYKLTFRSDDMSSLIDCILVARSLINNRSIINELREYVVREHSLNRLINLLSCQISQK